MGSEVDSVKVALEFGFIGAVESTAAERLLRLFGAPTTTTAAETVQRIHQILIEEQINPWIDC